MGDVVKLGRPLNAVSAIRACRRELAASLTLDNDSRPGCVAAIARILIATKTDEGPVEAQDLIHVARNILRDGRRPSEQKYDLLLGIFQSPEAERFASPDLPKLT